MSAMNVNKTCIHIPFYRTASFFRREVQVHGIACNNQWHFTTRKLASTRPPEYFCTHSLSLLPGFCLLALLETDSIMWYAVASLPHTVLPLVGLEIEIWVMWDPGEMASLEWSFLSVYWQEKQFSGLSTLFQNCMYVHKTSTHFLEAFESLDSQWITSKAPCCFLVE